MVSPVDSQAHTARPNYTGFTQVREGGPLVKDGPFTPSPSLDERNVEAIEGWNDPDTKNLLMPAHRALSVAYVGLKQIADARQKAAKNGAWTPEMILLNVAGMAATVSERALGEFDKALKQHYSSVAALDDQLNTSLNASVTATYATEIRAVVRQLPAEQRTKLITDAMKNKDKQIVSAVLSAPALLTGIDPEMAKEWTRKWNEEAFPEATRRLAIERKAIDLLESRVPLIHSQITQALGASWDTVYKVREAHKEAQQALKAFNP